MSRLSIFLLVVLQVVLLAESQTTGTAGTTTVTDTTGTAVETTPALVTTIINKNIKVGRTTFKCKFTLVHTTTTVIIDSSKLSCKGKGKVKNPINVELASEDGTTFEGEIKIPNKIISMEITSGTTTGGTTGTTGTTEELTTGLPVTNSVEEVEFKEIYANVSSIPRPDYRTSCGIDTLEAEMAQDTKSYTNMHETQFWANARIDWSFVSVGDEYASFAVHTDTDIGLTKADVDTVNAAMKQIEASTCIRFNRVKPTKGQPWLLVSRDSRASDMSCQLDKIHSMRDTDIAGLGPIYARLWYSKTCFGGAYAWYGSASPQNFVISATTVSPNYQGDIGLVAHELLHNLGLGHTQKRQDAGDHIEILWNNIDPGNRGQYEPCIEANNPACKRYNDYGTPYDCSSIMHYFDTAFLTDAARAAGLKTMRAKRANCELAGHHTRLSEADITILNKMYCADRPVVQQKVITSPNYPQNYPDNQDKQYTLEVASGSVVVLKFTNFELEDESCKWDWVQIKEGNGKVIKDKLCGSNLPEPVTSKTNKMIVTFHSDSSANFKGFRAEWDKSTKAPSLVNGCWSKWTRWSTCSNNKDGKSTCRKRKARYCNSPPPSNGGKDCSGAAENWADCRSSDLSEENSNPLCVVTGGWSSWSSPSQCSNLCTSTRRRTCTNPAPINDKACTGDVTDSSTCTGGGCPSSNSGTINSPNYPAEYSNDLETSLPIEVPAGSKIKLTFTALDIEPDASCRYDYVKVMDTDGSELVKLCGADLPSSPYKSSGNKMTVVFKSDNTVTKTGFQATWKEMASSEAPTSGVITSPNYPDNYPHNQDNKKWVISVAKGKKVKLTVTELNIEPGEGCPYDHLRIFDGATLMAELCGPTAPTSPFTSSSNVMTLYFKSDGTVTFKGFSAKWEVKK